MAISKRQRRLAAEKLLSGPEGHFIEIDLTESKNVPSWCTRAFRNNAYTVTINDNAITTHGTAIRAMVQKHNDMPIHNHWATMQRIKNEIFGPEAIAIEYYPAESKLLDDHNIYWMWLFSSGSLPIPI